MALAIPPAQQERMMADEPIVIDATILGYVKSILTSLVTSALMAFGAFMGAHGLKIPNPDEALVASIVGILLTLAMVAYKAIKSGLDHKAKETLANTPPADVEVKK
jgi:hypothetical protein